MMRRTGLIVALLAGGLVGAYYAPASAQQVVRLYGTLVGTPDTPIAIGVNSDGAMSVALQGGTISPDTVNATTVNATTINATGNITAATGTIDANNFTGVALTVQSVVITGLAFASLGTPANGTLRFCTDCTITSPCAGGGTGALAKRLNGAWVCN